MGYFKHGLTCAVVHAWDKERVAAIDAWVKEVNARPPTPGTKIGSIARFEVNLNGFVVYVIPPDGSKEGWPGSDATDRLRGELVAFAPRNAVDVLFGGDEPEERSFTNQIPKRDEED